jgi:hypothetical protein
VAKSGTQTAADPQLKMVLDKMAAAGVTRPKLGCYPLVSEVTDIRRNGEQIGFAKQFARPHPVGEPDPWYFAIPTNYTARTGEEWNALILRLHQR